MAFTPLGLTSVSRPSPGFHPVDFSAPPIAPAVASQPPKGFFSRTLGYAQKLVAPAEEALTAGLKQTVKGAREGFTAQGVRDTALGIAGTVQAPLAPLFAPLNKGIEVAGSLIGRDKALQRFAITPRGADVATVAQDWNDASTIALALLGGVEGVRNIAHGVHTTYTGAKEAAGTRLNVPVQGAPESGAVPITKLERRVPVGGASETTPISFANDYRTGQDIPAGRVPKATSDMPTIQIGGKVRTAIPRGEPMYAPIATPSPEFHPIDLSTPPPAVRPTTEPVAPVTTEPAPVSTATPTTGTTPSGVALSIEAKAVEAGLTKKFSNVAGYDASTIKEQARIFSESANKGPEEVLAQIRGTKALPEGQKSAPFVVAVEQYMKDNPSLAVKHDMAYELANSPHTSAFSEHASQLGLSQNRTKDSFTEKADEIRKARQAKTRDFATKRTALPKRVAQEMNKVSLGAEDLGKIEKFIDAIIC